MNDREPSKPKKITTMRRGKPFKTWLIYYKLDGKECRFTSVSKDKVDAKVKQVKEQIEHNGGIYRSTSLGNCHKLFLIHRATMIGVLDGISRRHYENDERHLRLHISQYFEPQTNITTINAGRINFFNDEMKKNGLSGKTRRAILSTLNLMFKYAISMGWVNHNPCSRSERDIIRGSSQERVDFSLEELSLIHI